jgi:hypothetical protein
MLGPARRKTPGDLARRRVRGAGGRRVQSMRDGLESIDAPNCPSCLSRCEVAGTVAHPYWLCSQCRTVVLNH